MVFALHDQVNEMGELIGKEMAKDKARVETLSKIIYKCVKEIEELKEANKDLQEKYKKLLMDSL